MLSLPLLHRPGKEGAYAALVLARVYCRPDAVAALPAFFTWVAGELEEGDKDSEANLVASLLEMLALLPGMLPPGHLHVLKAFTEDRLLPHLRGSRTAAGSSLVRKLAVKARGRWWVSRLTRATGKDAGEGLDEWLADGLEMESDDLLSGLSDKDTIVRYSSAKYLARLAFALPSDFAEQLVSATIDLFAGTEEEPVLYTTAGTVLDPGGNAFGGAGTMGFGGSETSRGEARWHGTCLAIAELARRGLVRDEAIGVAIPWVLKVRHNWMLAYDTLQYRYAQGPTRGDAVQDTCIRGSDTRAEQADVPGIDIRHPPSNPLNRLKRPRRSRLRPLVPLARLSCGCHPAIRRRHGHQLDIRCVPRQGGRSATGGKCGVSRGRGPIGMRLSSLQDNPSYGGPRGCYRRVLVA